jgi:hypothetical protein
VIKEQFVATIDDLTRALNELPNHFIFRGQANASWSLQSGLERVLANTWSKDRARKFEEYSLQTFKSKYHIYNELEHTPTSKLGWLSVMQHYGVPTRLLDFTTSPYIALYFALETYVPSSGNDFAVYVIDYEAILSRSSDYVKGKDSKFSAYPGAVALPQDQIYEEVLDRYSYDIVWVGEPETSNVRIERQSGTFLMSGTLDCPVEDVLNAPLYHDVIMRRIRIPASLYTSCYVALRKMNINSKSLYGDLFGLAKAIRMDFSVYV